MLIDAFAGVWRLLVAFLGGAGRVVLFSLSSVGATLRTREALSATAAQTVHLVHRCLGPVLLVVGPVAGMLAMQSLNLTRAFGVERLLPPLLSATVVRELAPGFSAVMVCFQAGAGIAAELGTMRVEEELDALEVMGVDPRAWVAGPRIIGAALAAMVLNAVAMAVGVVGAYLVAVGLFDMPHAVFAHSWLDGVLPSDLWLSELKSAIFGLGLGAVSATFGYHARGGSRGVGLAANRTVVSTVILVLVMNYLLNTAIFGLRGGM